MRYHVKKRDKDQVFGPLTLEEIGARVRGCRLDRWDMVLSDNGQTPEQLKNPSDFTWETVTDVLSAPQNAQMVKRTPSITFEDLHRQEKLLRRAAANKMIISGALWCIGGIIATTITISLASASPKDGTVVIFWGAIFFGFIRFVRGMASR